VNAPVLAVMAQVLAPQGDRGAAASPAAGRRAEAIAATESAPSPTPRLQDAVVAPAQPLQATGLIGTEGKPAFDPGPADLRLPDVGPFQPQGATTAPASAAVPVHAGSAPPAADPRAVAAQLAEAFVATRPDGTVEVGLRPEELGRVRMILTPDGGGMTVTLAAERPETLDLMRRTIDTLASDLRDLGYTGLTFRFDRQGQPGSQSGGQRDGARDGQPDAVARTGGISAAAASAAASPFAGLPGRDSSRLDIRL
jgi:hypothetical protein